MVALHFATNEIEHFKQTGMIWALNYVKLNQFLPQKLKAVIQDEASNVFTAEMLERHCQSLNDLGQLEKEPFLLFLEPPSMDYRIVNQYALFSLMSNSQSVLGDWLAKHPETYFRIHIPADLKWEIRDKLDQSNITERVLFPGLSGLSMWLKRHYSPRNE
jgi:hypothetical protein